MKDLFKIIVLLCASTAVAQLPETQIFLADVEIKSDLIKVEKAQNITPHKGYNNQPYFTPDGKWILFAAEGNTEGKVHISRYDLKGKKIKKGTATKTSEYSPAVTPDGLSISAVVVEEDSSQRVWLYDEKTCARKSCVHTGTDSIGYYAWFGMDTLIYYKLTAPHSLRVLDIKTGEDNWICNSPTRSFKKINATTFFYVIQEEKQNLVYFYDVRTKKATLHATDKTESLDYVWQPDLGITKSVMSRIYQYKPDTKVWAVVADLSSFGVGKITRYAFSPDKKKLAVVTNAEPK